MGKSKTTTRQTSTPEKFFNIAGPSVSEDHYMLDPLRRIDYDEIRMLINQKQYFVLHAPRQTGKTTSLLAMVKHINNEGRYHCVYVNVESAQTARNDVARGMLAILSRLESAITRFLKCRPLDIPTGAIVEKSPDAALISALETICESLKNPLVLFVD
jgi:hypothetical protein